MYVLTIILDLKSKDKQPLIAEISGTSTALNVNIACTSTQSQERFSFDWQPTNSATGVNCVLEPSGLSGNFYRFDK